MTALKLVLVLGFALSTVASSYSRAMAQAAGQPLQYNRDVLPILSENCFACHGFDEAARQADLRLDEFEGALQAITAGKPDESELIRRIESEDEYEQMPPPDSEKKLTAEQRVILRQWIAEGAEYQLHWSFEVPQRAEPPAIAGVHHPIDNFIQARLAAEGLSPSPLASPATQLRRVTLDLIGLPPTLEELDAFAAAAADDPERAYRAEVERLLQSPHYGERWGRWWLDQARYADSNGYSIDAPRQIWKFRDWVIEALNSDMPFDQFTVEQLAGDLLPDATQSQKVATGFHRNTQINQEGGIDKEQFRIDSVFDRTATTGTVWLGLTIGCAQCHDHKFDPIKQSEYYRMFAFFNNQDEPTLKVYDEGSRTPQLLAQLEQAAEELDAHIAQRADAYLAWESQLTDQEKSKMPGQVRKLFDVSPDERSAVQRRTLFNIEVGKIDDEYQELLSRYEELDGRVNGATTTLVLEERTEPRETHVLIKGDFTRPSTQVEPGTPEVLHPLTTEAELPNRFDLAQWIVDPSNPLTSRVIVNRVWQVYFGRGIVETENDFGSLGAPPTHPELLDWLAVEFRESGWSLKELHRSIVTSHTYRQSSSVRDGLTERDPNNYLLGRQQRLRLDAELIRDVSLSVSGLLAAKLKGPPVFPPIPDGVMSQGQVKRSWKVSHGDDRYRRGLYTFIYRATPPPSLSVFDAPDGFSTCTRRTRSNTPLQALTLLNDAAYYEFAGALAEVIEDEGLEQAFRRCTARLPSADELAILHRLDALGAARVLLNLDETVTRE